METKTAREENREKIDYALDEYQGASKVFYSRRALSAIWFLHQHCGEDEFCLILLGSQSDGYLRVEECLLPEQEVSPVSTDNEESLDFQRQLHASLQEAKAKYPELRVLGTHHSHGEMGLFVSQTDLEQYAQFGSIVRAWKSCSGPNGLDFMLGPISVLPRWASNSLEDLKMLILLCDERGAHQVDTFFIPADYQYASHEAVKDVLGPIDGKLVKKTWPEIYAGQQAIWPDDWLAEEYEQVPCWTGDCQTCVFRLEAQARQALPAYCLEHCDFGRAALAQGIFGHESDLLDYILLSQEEDQDEHFEPPALQTRLL